MRDEFLKQARQALEQWRDHNQLRPHSSIGWLAPAVYASQFFPPPGQALRAAMAPRLGPRLYPCMMAITARL